jgi:2-C-methyl-D-erythritol 2,4-cyclodiphosphate synthase
LRIGQGVDLHRFGSGDGPLILGGVTIPGAPPLVGHSDADALSHALADAVLGAASLGDLGRHFPDTDPAWAGADSLDLLGRVVGLAKRAGLKVVNADCTVVAEVPRLSPFLDQMASRVSAVVEAPVSVKATRAEGMGPVGAREGIACLAVVLLETVPASATTSASPGGGS